MRLSIVVPCYNEADVLPAFNRRMIATCEAVAGGDFEIIYVNDGSTDATMNWIVRFNERDSRIVGIDLFRNHGHQLAASAGLQMARGERTLLIDADLQDPPELLAEFWNEMDQGYDVVYGQRSRRVGESWFKRVSAQLFYRGLASISETAIPLDTGDFRLMNRDVVDILNDMPERHRFLRGMVAWIGGRQKVYVYERDRRAAGKTKYTFLKMVSFAVDAVTGFSTMPLRIATYLAFATVLATALLAAYVLYSYLFLDVVAGWTSLGVIVLAVSAIQMFAIGVLGEYLGRLYVQSQGRPTMLVKRRVGGENSLPKQMDAA
jgi:polyisoprenyl-phosphate glycosyltransferase